jgi:hypothetical protein
LGFEAPDIRAAIKITTSSERDWISGSEDPL